MSTFKRSSESTTQTHPLPTPNPMIMSHDHSDLFELLPKLESKMTPKAFILLKQALHLQMARKMGDTQAVSDINKQAIQKILDRSKDYLLGPIPEPIASQNPDLKTIFDLLQHHLDEQAKQQGCTQGWTAFFIQQIQFLSTPSYVRGHTKSLDTYFPDGSVDYNPDDLTILNWTYMENGISSTLNPNADTTHTDYETKKALVLGIDYLISENKGPLTKYPADTELSCLDVSIGLACGVFFYDADAPLSKVVDGARNSKGNTLRHDFNHLKHLKHLLPVHPTQEQVDDFTRTQWSFLCAMTDPKLFDSDRHSLYQTHFSMCHEFGISKTDLLDILENPKAMPRTIFGLFPRTDQKWHAHCLQYLSIPALHDVFPKEDLEALTAYKGVPTEQLNVARESMERTHQQGISIWSKHHKRLFPKSSSPRKSLWFPKLL